ncbi:zinc-binding dehydrogenase [Nocardia blacklockiae]|uniref:zinc-binding dehydrogenase n=1 Tax=Nocardia blacklockiae TaxID=480036 RepID=UPI0018951219|nr:zinc-binding dehydrogenase [Nocardia blacklockiae]MBF6176585.1 zinc-binding dehydrogenase [Nocardia blacklockiae]
MRPTSLAHDRVGHHTRRESCPFLAQGMLPVFWVWPAPATMSSSEAWAPRRCSTTTTPTGPRRCAALRRLDALTVLVEAGKLRPIVEAVLPLEQSGEALARVAGGHTRGKIVVQIAP